MNTVRGGHEALRRGRNSCPQAEYFLTLCTRDRRRGLEGSELTAEILLAAHRLESEAIWMVRTATVMPDHLHLLINLGERVNLAGAVRMFKGRLSPSLRKAGLGWERAYFDHRMHATEDRLPVFRYIFMNPYRAGLLLTNEKWPSYFCCQQDWAWFAPLTNEDCPFPEWLG